MQHIDKLKGVMLKAKDLHVPWDYFFDHCAESDEFFDLGRRVGFADLQTVIEKVAQQMINSSKTPAKNFLIIEIPSHQFYHGSFFVGRYLGNFMFFKDIDVGMVAVTTSPRSREVICGRFSIMDTLDSSSAVRKQSLN